MNTFFKRGVIFSVVLLLCFTASLKAQLTTTYGASATAIATAIAGPGVTVSNATWTNPQTKAIGSFIATATNLGITSGIILCNGDIITAIGPNNAAGNTLPSTGFSGGFNTPGDPDLQALINNTATNDAAILEFDIIPTSDTIKFRYVFGSEEYPEYVCSNVNDVFAFFISGPGIVGKYNMATIPGSATAVQINTVNPGNATGCSNAVTCGLPFQQPCCSTIQCNLGNSAYYVDNTGGATIQFDGFTKVLNASALVQACQTYHIKIAIADAGDTEFDSGVFIERGSLTSVPYAYAGPDKSFCSGGSAQIGSNPLSGYTYSWSPTTGLSNPSVSNPTVSLVGAAGTSYDYTVTATKGGCISNTDVVKVTLTPSGIAATTSSTQTSCAANTGTASINVTAGTSPYTYSWNTTPVQTTATASNLAAGTYSVLVTGANGCSSSFTTNVTAPGGGVASVSTKTDVNCFGGNNGSATASITGGTAPYTFSWNNGANTATATNLSAGTYTCTVRDANGCSSSASVTVNQPSALSVILSKQNVACAGQANGAITSLVTGGTAPYSYSWSDGSANANLSSLSAGGYTLTVTDANGCSNTKSATVSQPAVLAITTLGTDPLCFNACNGVGTATVTGGTSPYAYTWSNNALTASTNALCSGDNIVTVTDSAGCVVKDTLTLLNPTDLQVSTSSQAANCYQANGIATVTATGGDGSYTYTWVTSPAQNAATAINLIPGSYKVLVVDGKSCKDSATVIVANIPGVSISISSTQNPLCVGSATGKIFSLAQGGTAPYTYAWTASQAQVTDSVIAIPAGNHCVYVQDASGCKDTACTTLVDPTPVVVNVNGPDTLCIGQSGTLMANATGGLASYNYNWDGVLSGPMNFVNPTSTTTYTVFAEDANGCVSAPKTWTVVLNPPLTLGLSGVSEMCPGGIVNVSANPSGGGGGYTYQWMPGGANAATISVSPLTTTTYTVIVNDVCGSPAKIDSIRLVVHPKPVAGFTSDTLNGCIPLCINLTDTSNVITGTIANWEWHVDSVTYTNGSSIQYCFTQSGFKDVSLKVITDKGCVDSVQKSNYVEVFPKPDANFVTSPAQVSILEPKVQFTDLSLGNPVAWMWSFDDVTDSASILQNPSYTYGDTGTYCPRLVVMNQYGCIDSTIACLRVLPHFTFYIPNAFTPNGDNLNDVFIGQGDYIAEFEMYIYDRWGNKIFYSQNPQKGWDGRLASGVLAMQDVYVYLINITDINGKFHQFNGHFSLVGGKLNRQ